jgi:DNA-binding NarL/FixJ family response regulator
MDRMNLLLVDDQKLFVDNLKIVLESRAKDMKVVGIATNGVEALEMTETLRPSIVLMDVRMPVMDGVTATKMLHRSHPEIRIIMLTTFDDDEYVHQALKFGAVGYILKTASSAELISALRAVRDGAVLFSPSIAGKLVHTEAILKTASATMMSRDRMQALLESLTNREIELINLISLAYDNRQIAEKLNIAEQTVKNNIGTVFDKVGVNRRTQLMRFFGDCRNNGLIE